MKPYMMRICYGEFYGELQILVNKGWRDVLHDRHPRFTTFSMGMPLRERRQHGWSALGRWRSPVKAPPGCRSAVPVDHPGNVGAIPEVAVPIPVVRQFAGRHGRYARPANDLPRSSSRLAKP